MEVTVKGHGKVRLDRRYFHASGGEGHIFARGDIGYKIHVDPSTQQPDPGRMIPIAKIDELSALTAPNILRPLDIILDTKNRPIGYTTRFVRDTYTLCQAFTQAFKQREKMTQDRVIKIVQMIQDGLRHCHDHNILAVDVNELNFLLRSDFGEVFFIDVNSYQTPHFPATAIMESIRDRHCNRKFNANTDWFSFGIITFQLFIGIHPFKGKHPGFESIKPVDRMDARMKKNISVFNSQVTLPRVCLPFDVIPQAYRDWYRAIFEDGKRMPPPGDVGEITVIKLKIEKITGTDNFDITEIAELQGDIINFLSLFGVKMIATNERLYLDKVDLGISSGGPTLFAITPKQNHAIVATRNNRKLKLYDASARRDVECDMACDDFLAYDGRIYVRHEGTIYEIEFVELPNRTIVGSKIVANVLEQSAQMFDGVVVQNLLNAFYVSLFPQSGHHIQVRMKELDDYRVLDAKFDHNVLMVIGEKKGQYDRFIFRFTLNYASYDIRRVKDIPYADLNFVVLENNICACITENEELELISNRKDSSSVRIIQDTAVKGGMKLFRDGVNVLFAEGNSLYRLKMK